MSRWGKNIVVPLDTLCKEKESTNRPTVARSVGTVGKWGKMGFTSTRTYTLSALPSGVAAAAAAMTAASPVQASPASGADEDMSISVPEPPKPKKFFKSRNAAPPELIAQIIQQLPRISTSPTREAAAATDGTSAQLAQCQEQPMKVKLPKSSSTERKKKTPTKPPKTPSTKKQSKKKTPPAAEGSVVETPMDTTVAAASTTPTQESPVVKSKSKKKKEEKKLKPEAPPSRVLGRARKTVNYCEDDEEERFNAAAKNKAASDKSPDEQDASVLEPVLPPPSSIPTNSSAQKTPEHPPIVLRISKGTSRLVSTDSEEQQTANNTAANSPQDLHDAHINAPPAFDVNSSSVGGNTKSKSRHTSVEETVPSAPKVFVKTPKPPSSSEPQLLPPPALNYDETPEINYSIVKISPDKPPKERLKLIIKTDVIRNALAAAAKAASNAEKNSSAYGSGAESGERSEKEKKSKVKKHKHLKHAATTLSEQQQQQQTAQAEPTPISEFKIPSPHVSLNEVQQHQQHLNPRTVISPPAISERDFDSQSSVLGSISSKGNSTPQPIAPTLQEESCVLHSRGSSVITSDLETSQHSSLVAPPSEIELRLESMMMDGEVSQPRPTSVVQEEPLQKEDLIAVLRGDQAPQEIGIAHGSRGKTTKMNGIVGKGEQAKAEAETEGTTATANTRRVTRGRGRGANTTKSVEDVAAPDPAASTPEVQTKSPTKTTPQKGQGTASTRATRNRKPLVDTTASEAPEQETTPTKRATRRGAKKADDANSIVPMEVDTTATSKAEEEITSSKLNEGRLSPNKSEEENTTPVSQLQQTTPPAVATRRGTRANRNAGNNSNLNTNSNINKIAANLSAKAGAAAATAVSDISNNNNNNSDIAATVVPATLQSAAPPAITVTTTTATTTIGTISTATAPTVTRSYGRKRKNQQVMQVLQPSAEELEEHQMHHHPTPAKVPNMELSNSDSEMLTATRLNNEMDSTKHHQLSNDAAGHGMGKESSSSSPPPRDYKVKDKFKRTLTLDNQVNCNAVSLDSLPQSNDPMSSDDAAVASSLTNNGNNTDHDDDQRGAVKLVITKKKGSIFKSRALVPSDHTEQAAASKRHLYKHSWNAMGEANGNAAENSKDKTLMNDNHSQKQKSADNIYDEFENDNSNDGGASATGISGGASSAVGGGNGGVGGRDNHSPSIGKLTRVIKPNPQAFGSASSGNAANNSNTSSSSGSSGVYNNDFDTETITSVKVDRKAKDYYTVVRNVKTAHQIQEIGEYQEMDDDVEYILDALQPHNPTPTRCLSALQLATKCMNSAFRMHVRAHGVVSKFFKALSDANNDLSLGLCTSAIMFILSQEGLNMDLDRDSLELMTNLLESEGIAAPSDRASYERNRQKVRELCEEIKAQGKAAHLNVESITVGTLAMETLLSLTSKRAGEWFKEELRELGGLEHIIKTISELCRPAFESSSKEQNQRINWNQSLLDNMQTVERCLRVLENVTQMNEENQKYILTYAQGTAIDTLCTLYRICNNELMHSRTNETSASAACQDSPVVIMRDLLIPVMKVLINLTHPFNPQKPFGAELIGQRAGIIDISFQLLFLAPNYIPERNIFDLTILVLLLLINLSMHSPKNRTVIMAANAPSEYISQSASQNKNMTAVQALMEYFYKCEELARLVEKNTDAFLDNQEKNKKKQEEVDETVNNLLQKAGHHMEHTLKGSYAGMLIGHLITDNEQNEMAIRKLLRGNGFKEIVSVLEKYYTFMNLTASTESSVVAHIKSTKKLMDYFKKRDLVYEMNEGDDNALPLNLETHHHHHRDDDDLPFEAMGSSSSGSNTQRVFKTYSQR